MFSLTASTRPVVCLLAAMSLMSFIACEAAGPPAVDTAAEAEVIMELEREWSNRLSAGDVDWIVNLHAPNARQMPEGAESVVGAAALRAAWQAMVDTEGLQVSWEPVAAHVSSGGDMAYDYGRATVTTPDGVTLAQKYLVVWTRINGEWKVAADMFNSDAPPPPAAN